MIDYVLVVIMEKINGKIYFFKKETRVSFHHFRSAVMAAALLSSDSSLDLATFFLKGSSMMRGYTFYMNITLNCSRTLLHS